MCGDDAKVLAAQEGAGGEDDSAGADSQGADSRRPGPTAETPRAQIPQAYGRGVPLYPEQAHNSGDSIISGFTRFRLAYESGGSFEISGPFNTRS